MYKKLLVFLFYFFIFRYRPGQANVQFSLCDTRFSIVQNLREIDFGDSRSAKFTILTHLVALNFDILEILPLLKPENTKITNLEPLKLEKRQF